MEAVAELKPAIYVVFDESDEMRAKYGSKLKAYTYKYKRKVKGRKVVFSVITNTEEF